MLRLPVSTVVALIKVVFPPSVIVKPPAVLIVKLATLKLTLPVC